ncbi:MAG: TerC family protein [Armatimonadetes bacterium]|nr:TerC family protein [Armatimonadota bacterium]
MEWENKRMTTESLIALTTLTAMEVVLGIDNVVFIAIVAARLPAAQQPRVRQIGLMLALVTRVGLLFTLSWMMNLTQPLFDVLGWELSGRSLILLAGGLFLIGKSTHEIHVKLEGESDKRVAPQASRLGWILLQIAVLDIVFSLDSVITAVGMARSLGVMIAAMVLAMGVMLVSAGPISSFINAHPTFKILALSFLLLIGVMLVAEGAGQHIEKGYIYFAMAFSLFVELLNMRLRGSQSPVRLNEPKLPEKGTSPG